MEEITKNSKGRIIHADCIEHMRTMASGSVDLVVTDPPYLVNYRDRDGRTIENDTADGRDWLRPAFAEIYRVLKDDSFCLSFYGFSRAEEFLEAWKGVGFKVLEHFVFPKPYPSSERYAKRYHEAAYLLGKGRPEMPHQKPASVIDWYYSGNRYHPTQKPYEVIAPMIKAYSKPGDIVLDPFSGSGTTALCAEWLNRKYIGIEKDKLYYLESLNRLRLNR